MWIFFIYPVTFNSHMMINEERDSKPSRKKLYDLNTLLNVYSHVDILEASLDLFHGSCCTPVPCLYIHVFFHLPCIAASLNPPHNKKIIMWHAKKRNKIAATHEWSEKFIFPIRPWPVVWRTTYLWGWFWSWESLGGLLIFYMNLVGLQCEFNMITLRVS